MKTVSQQLEGIPVKTINIGSGTSAIFKTVHNIKKIIMNAAFQPYVRRWAENIVYSIPQGDKFGEARAIYDFVVESIRYTKDPKGLEFIQTPDLLLRFIEADDIATGDCDDITTLGMALLKSIGFDVAVKITSYSHKRQFQHVYGLVYVNGEWLAFDAIRPDKFLGWEAPGITRSKIYKI
jgi:hypothetical protein